MSPNYEYLLTRAARAHPTRLLDYGCGGGDVVREAVKRGFDAYGVDVYFGAAHDSYKRAQASGLFGTRIREMESDTRIPFPDGHFDFVTCNQVFEHVRDLPPVLAEMRRVMAPGGILLALFPTTKVLLEGHFGIPLVHHLPRGRLRFSYTLTMRALGLGFHTHDPWTRSQWVNYWLDWMDRFTFYRPHADVDALLSRHFDVRYVEPEWIRFRLEARGWNWALPIVPDFIARQVARRLGSTVIEARAR